jgi:hypothetical protein
MHLFTRTQSRRPVEAVIAALQRALFKDGS